jgi:hypothetical protein
MIPRIEISCLGSTSDAGGAHAKLRYGMSILLDLEPDIEVFSEASDL